MIFWTPKFSQSVFPKLYSDIEKSEVIKIKIIIEVECWLFPILSSFGQSKYSFIHSKTKKAQLRPRETSLWVWSRCSVQKVCGFKCNQISKDSEVFVHQCQFLNLCLVYMKKKTRGLLKCYGSFYSECMDEWQTASVLPELFNVKQDQIISWELRQRSTYVNINWSRWTRALSSMADDIAK